MRLSEKEIRLRLLEYLSKNGPAGWYRIEHAVIVPPEAYPAGVRTMATPYLIEMSKEGLVDGSEETNFSITDKGLRLLEEETL